MELLLWTRSPRADGDARQGEDGMADFVLVHGAYQGGWIWQRVARRLRAEGHRVHAPTLDGCAERHHQLRPGITVDVHATEIAQLLFYEDLGEAVLVGTSSGGMVVCRAAELARERVGRLVLVDALALIDGERVADVVDRPAPVTTDLAIGPSRADAADRLFAELDPTTRAWALARYTMHPIAAMVEPARLERFWSEPWAATVIRCRRSVNPPEAHQRRAAERLGAAWRELDTGHYPMLTTPAELAALVAEG